MSELVTATEDEPPKRLNEAKMRSLKPHFRPHPVNGVGTITAANAPALCDGAAALLLARQSTAAQLGLPTRARILAMADAEHVRIQPGLLSVRARHS